MAHVSCWYRRGYNPGLHQVTDNHSFITRTRQLGFPSLVQWGTMTRNGTAEPPLISLSIPMPSNRQSSMKSDECNRQHGKRLAIDKHLRAHKLMRRSCGCMYTGSTKPTSVTRRYHSCLLEYTLSCLSLVIFGVGAAAQAYRHGCYQTD